MPVSKFKIDDLVTPIYDSKRMNKIGRVVEIEKEKVWDEYKNGKSYYFYKFYYYVKFKDESDPICYGGSYIELAR